MACLASFVRYEQRGRSLSQVAPHRRRLQRAGSLQNFGDSVSGTTFRLCVCVYVALFGKSDPLRSQGHVLLHFVPKDIYRIVCFIYVQCWACQSMCGIDLHRPCMQPLTPSSRVVSPFGRAGSHGDLKVGTIQRRFMAAEIVNDNSDAELGSLRGVTREELLNRLRDGD